MKHVPKKFFVILGNGVGDIIIHQSIFKYLKYKDSKTIIDVLVPHKYQIPLIERMPEVRKIFIMPSKKTLFTDIKNLFGFSRKIAERNYTTSIILSKKLESCLIPFLAKIPRRIGTFTATTFFIKNLFKNDVRIITIKARKHLSVFEKHLYLAKDKKEAFEDLLPLSRFYPKLTTSIESEEKTLKKYHIAVKNGPILCLCPGSVTSPKKKRWPYQHFAQVANMKRKEGWQVLIFGNKQERELGEKINKLNNHKCLDLTGKTTIDEICDILDKATVVVSNDNGLMHMAAALNVKLVAIFGARSPNIWPPLTENAHILSLNLPCKPCHGNCSHLICLWRIYPHHVLNAIENLILNKK